MESVSAVVIAAGATEDGPLARLAVGGHKALIGINGRPAVSYLVDSLKACEPVQRVIVVGDDAVFDAVPDADVRVSASPHEAENVLAGIRAAEDSSRCLLMTGDMPLVSAEALADLLTNAPDSDVVYPITSQADVETLCPERQTGYLKTKEGNYTGSSCLLFRTEAALSREKMLTELLEARKNPKALLALIGPWVGLKIMLSTLSLGELERSLSGALKIDCRVFITHYAEMLFSIDSPDDVRLIERQIC